jgi:hypothetical protein
MLKSWEIPPNKGQTPTLNNEGQEHKTIHLKGRAPVEESKEGECGWCIFYININMEHWNLLKSPQEGEWGKRENNGGDKPIWDVIHVYMEMSPQNSLCN